MTSAAAIKVRPNIRHVKVELWRGGAFLVHVGVVVADEIFPELIYWDGLSFLRDATLGPYVWRQVVPYRINVGE